MTATERAILVFFRRYEIGPHKMLFFNPSDCKLAASPFRTAMQSLMSRGVVIKERPIHAYSLTQYGYNLSVSIQIESQN